MRMECTYCSAVSECSCPDDLQHRHPEARHVCLVCIELLGMGVKEDELKASPKRREAADRLESEEFSEALAFMVADGNFDKIWNEGKDGLKLLSKKELAHEAYFQGIKAGVLVMAAAHKAGEMEKMLKDFKEGKNAKEPPGKSPE